MLRSRLRALLITALICMHKISRSMNVPELSVLLPLSTSISQDHAACHQCLVISAGFEKICLLQVKNKFRLYRIESFSGIFRSFITHCQSRKLCSRHVNIPANFNIEEPKIAISPRSTDMESYKSMEGAIFALIHLVPSSMTTRRAFQLKPHLRNKHGSFLEKKLSIPFSFAGRILNKKNSNVLEPVAEEPLSSLNQNKEESDPSARCMILIGLKSDAVCRECLAMHSKRFALRSYILFYDSTLAKAELLVFRSNHNSADIESNCRKKLCRQVFSWDRSDCQIVNFIFPMHRNVLKVQEKTYNWYEEQYIENTMNLDRIKQVLDVIAIEKMQRAGQGTENSHNSITFPSTLGMLRSKKALCLNITASPNRKWDCINCILRNVGEARLAIVMSIRNTMIITTCIKRRLECVLCINLSLLKPDRCEHYLQESVMNIDTYPKPTDSHVLDHSLRHCIVLYYTPSREASCIRCMKISLSTTRDPYVLTKTSSLVDTSNLDAKLAPSSIQELLNCNNRDKCIRLQKVPNLFCSVHAAIILGGSSLAIISTNQIKFTQEGIPIGFWPPQKHRVVMSQYKSGHTSETWPAFHNTIFLVQFEYATSTFSDCINSLLEHTEVFFAYSAEATLSGYVWMRPAPSNILRICVKKSCTNLGYYDDRKQFERPAGIQHLTRADFRILPGT